MTDQDLNTATNEFIKIMRDNAAILSASPNTSVAEINLDNTNLFNDVKTLLIQITAGGGGGANLSTIPDTKHAGVTYALTIEDAGIVLTKN